MDAQSRKKYAGNIERIETLLRTGKERIHKSAEAYMEFLAFAARFPRYSYENQLLIYMQNPDATACAGYDIWKRVGRQVKRGSKGILISADDRKGYAHVFDVENTEAELPLELRSLNRREKRYIAENMLKDGAGDASGKQLAGEDGLDQTFLRLALRKYMTEAPFADGQMEAAYEMIAAQKIIGRFHLEHEEDFGEARIKKALSELSPPQWEEAAKKANETANGIINELLRTAGEMKGEKENVQEREEKISGRGKSAASEGAEGERQTEGAPGADRRGSTGDVRHGDGQTSEGEPDSGGSEEHGHAAVDTAEESGVRPGQGNGSEPGVLQLDKEKNREREEAAELPFLMGKTAEEREQYADISSDVERLGKEITACLNGQMDRQESLMITEHTPQLLQQVGLEDLPILFSQGHVRNCLHEKDNNPHHHGLDRSHLELLPYTLAEPAMIFDSLTASGIVVATGQADRDGLPVIASIRPSGSGQYHFEKLDSNYLTSVYGKDRFENFLKRNIEEGNVLYVNKEKTQVLGNLAKLQLLGRLPQNIESDAQAQGNLSKLQLLGGLPQSFEFNTIIRKSKHAVNHAKEKNGKSAEDRYEIIFTEAMEYEVRDREENRIVGGEESIYDKNRFSSPLYYSSHPQKEAFRSRAAAEMFAETLNGDFPEGVGAADIYEHFKSKDMLLTNLYSPPRGSDEVIERRKERLAARYETLRESAKPFKISSDVLGEGSKKERLQNNFAALRLLRTLEVNGRPATDGEKEILSKYVGFGGLAEVFDENNEDYSEECKALQRLYPPYTDEYRQLRESIASAFYTPPQIAKGMFTVLKRTGADRQLQILEPSCGTGNFIGSCPADIDAHFTGIEKDIVSAKIARALYPDAEISISGFEATGKLTGKFDAVIGNVPFADFKVFDPEYKEESEFFIHDYFCLKSLDALKTGGVLAFITSAGTMDKQNPKARKEMAKRADFLGAVRLPNDAFSKAAGTNTTADIIFLKKREKPLEVEPDWVFSGKNGDANINPYFLDNPEMVCGTIEYRTNRFGKKQAVCVPGKRESFEELFEKALQKIAPGEPGKEPAEEKQENKESEIITARADARNFTFLIDDGKLYFKESSAMEKSDRSHVVL